MKNVTSEGKCESWGDGLTSGLSENLGLDGKRETGNEFADYEAVTCQLATYLAS